MMNLELLFEASKITGDSSFYKIAVKHPDLTLKNAFRKGYSSYHVGDFASSDQLISEFRVSVFRPKMIISTN